MRRVPSFRILLAVSSLVVGGGLADEPIPDRTFGQWVALPVARAGDAPPAVGSDGGWSFDGRRLAGGGRSVAAARLPAEPVRCLAADDDGVWCGTDRGLFHWDGRRFRFFAGRRWLPDDRVRAVATLADGVRVWTAGPAVDLVRRPMTLADKAARYEAMVPVRHDRFGLVSACHLRAPGDLGTAFGVDNDNDGLWTSMYVAACCLRFAATGDDEARRRARHHLEALFRLEAVTGIAGFPARSVTRPGPHGGGEWHRSADGAWDWKGDTSSDELVGHFLAYYLYFEHVATDDEKAEIAAVVGRILDHLLDNDLALVDVDGRPTRWGIYTPERFGLAAWLFARGLQSLEILSHLKVGIHITGRDRFRDAYSRLVARGYARNVPAWRIEVPSIVNHSDDELAFLSFYPLVLLERDPTLAALFRRGLARGWAGVRPEANPLWWAIARAGGLAIDPEDGAAAIETLRDQPLDLVEWKVVNSDRGDVAIRPVRDRHGRLQSVEVLPVGERPLHKHNGNPYQLDGGRGGTREEPPTLWLLPYWMSRHHGLIE